MPAHCENCNSKLYKTKYLNTKVIFGCLSCNPLSFFLDDEEKNHKLVKAKLSDFVKWGMFKVFCETYKNEWHRFSWYTDKKVNSKGLPIIRIDRAWHDFIENRDWGEIVRDWNEKHSIKM